MLLLTLLFLIVRSSDLPRYQQFCHEHGFPECFPVSHVHTDMDQETVVVDNRDPISISHGKMLPIFILGETAWEFEFQTEWGSGVLIQKPDQSFIGEIPLENDVVLYIFPCTDRKECTNFGYELPRAVGILEEESDDDEESAYGEEDFADGRRRSLEALRRSLDSTQYDCEEQTIYPNSWLTTVCTITVRIAFPAKLPIGESWMPETEDYFAYGAALAVAEFNEALENGVNEDGAIYQMSLEHVDMVAWDVEQDPMDACWEYRQANDDSDLTQCWVYPAMGSGWGAAKVPWQSMAGTSWIHFDKMPGYYTNHVSAHEFGHNLGAYHTKYEGGDATLMLQGSDPNGWNRLLKFESDAVKADDGSTPVNNVGRVRYYYQQMAELH